MLTITTIPMASAARISRSSRARVRSSMRLPSALNGLQSMVSLSMVNTGIPPCSPTVNARSPYAYHSGRAAISSSVCRSGSQRSHPKRAKRSGAALSSKIPWMRRAFISSPWTDSGLPGISL